MMSQRRILTLVAAAAVVTAVAYVLVRDTGLDARALDVGGDTTTTEPDVVPASSPSTPADPPVPGQPRLGPVPTTTVPAPAFSATVTAVTATDLGSSWRDGCPVGPEQLRAVDAMHWGYDGSVHTGRLIIADEQAEAVVAVLRDLYDARFPIERMVPVHHYDSDDLASMVDNNTSAFNCRTVGGTTRWSEHAYGAAIDVNPLVNPYVKGSTVDPPEGAPWADRSRQDPGMIRDGDAAVAAFARQGWGWGGHWASGQDYQHFSASGR